MASLLVRQACTRPAGASQDNHSTDAVFTGQRARAFFLQPPKDFPVSLGNAAGIVGWDVKLLAAPVLNQAVYCGRGRRMRFKRRDAALLQDAADLPTHIGQELASKAFRIGHGQLAPSAEECAGCQ